MRDSAYAPIEIPVGFWYRPDVIEALAKRDIGELFRLVHESTGASQMRIGAATGYSQGRISVIMKGTYHPRTLETLTRIADGLNMPGHARRTLGLAPTDAASKPAPGSSGSASVEVMDT